jgi:hypothetical protein
VGGASPTGALLTVICVLALLLFPAVSVTVTFTV